uniref:Uncharacterized protein n=1 Tax=Anguilla anguilla TaxID=7936 RepID=A0A0E9SNE7_ANGAN
MVIYTQSQVSHKLTFLNFHYRKKC